MGKKKAKSKYKDATAREALDLQANHVLHSHTAASSASDPSAAQGGHAASYDGGDPFSYGAGTEEQRRQTRKQVEATADALNALCDLMH